LFKAVGSRTTSQVLIHKYTIKNKNKLFCIKTADRSLKLIKPRSIKITKFFQWAWLQEAQKGVSTPPICAPAAMPKGDAKPQNSQCSRQAGGTKRGLYAPNLRTCSHAQRRCKTAERANGQGRQEAQKGVFTPPFRAPTAMPKGRVYHYITITLYHHNMIQ